jgi:hypothetical protein
MILRCTQKFLKELRLKKSDIASYLQVEHPLDEWYAHVFTLYPRRKCAIFMHAKTKFCFYAYDKSRKQLNDDVGGIDLTRDEINIQKRGSNNGVQFNFDPAMVQQLRDASGLTPVIINIYPMTTTVPMFLGLSDKQEKVEALSML